MNFSQAAQILFLKKTGSYPIIATRHTYWTREDLAGTYDADPYHDENRKAAPRKRLSERGAGLQPEGAAGQ
jgi:hypothetical protein